MQFPKMVDVVVAGAGPTGLALATGLRSHGLDVLIVDRAEAGANTSRAAAVHARTLEVCETLGVTETLLQSGVQVPYFRVRDRNKVLLTVDFGRIRSAYPFTLMCPQNRIESILQARLEALGGSVVRQAALRSADQASDLVRVVIETPDATECVKAKWLVGCDGMHSRVRDIADIAFEGGTYAQSFVLADVTMDWPFSRDEVNLFFASTGLLVVAPLPEDRFRIVATIDEAPDEPSVLLEQSLLDERGPYNPGGRIRDLLWTARFKVHHRLVASPRAGRVLLCGDAAHVHSPAGGQGMNTGIQDAISLADVLADATDEKMDAWAVERHDIAADTVKMTDRLTRMATLRSPFGRDLRNVAIGLAGHIPHVTDVIARKLAEIDHR